MNTYDYGQLVRVIGTYTDPLNNNAPIDPSVVKLTLLLPTGSLITYVYGSGDNVIIHDSTGVYHADINFNIAGIWTYRWWSTGTGQASIEVQVNVLNLGAVDAINGTGTQSVEFIVNDSLGNPIPNCKVIISQEATGIPVIAGPTFTDANGIVNLQLNSGTYFAWREKYHYNFANPQTIVVS